MIKPPTGATPTKIKDSYRWYPYFKVRSTLFSYVRTILLWPVHDSSFIICQDCIGAIDGTHITARVSQSQSKAYRGRKHYTSQNVLAAVDFDLKFTYVLEGWEGSAHDATILSDSMSRPDRINIPDGKFYLGDAGYACRPGVLLPFQIGRASCRERV